MIKPTKRRLTVVFTVTIIFFNAIVLAISFATLNHTLLNSMKEHIISDARDEFLPNVKEKKFHALENMREHEIFQALSREGRIVTGTWGFRNFDLPVNRKMLAKAFAGEAVYEKLRFKGESYLVAYLPIDELYAGRVSMPLTSMLEYETNFFWLIILMLPVMLLFTFVISWYLVDQAMKPITSVFTFQENFSSNVTHELRTPLASLKGNLEVALRKKRSAEEYKEVLKLGLREVGRLVSLINNLYLLASSKFRPLELLQREANLKIIAEETLAVHKKNIGKKKIALHMEELNDITCVCDAHLIRRAIENLIDNAVKYTPPGGTISMRLSKEDHSIIFIISNTCDSLSRHDIKNFFEPFHRGENALNRHIEGKGLGLYIARYILRSHGGDLRMKIVTDGACTMEMVIGSAQN